MAGVDTRSTLLERPGNPADRHLPQHADAYSISLASGLIVGGAILAVIIALISALGLAPGAH